MVAKHDGETTVINLNNGLSLVTNIAERQPQIDVYLGTSIRRRKRVPGKLLIMRTKRLPDDNEEALRALSLRALSREWEDEDSEV